jgi:cytochrome c oxidase subunit 2
MRTFWTRKGGTVRWAAVAVAVAPLLSACQGAQSALAPQGPEAARVALLSWVMFIAAGGIMLGVMLLCALALYGRDRWRGWLARESVAIGGGVVFPVVTLSALLSYSLILTSTAKPASGAASPLKISVVGERWWWRVSYEDGAGRSFETANEIRIPVDRPVEVSLTTADVIHSFWAPTLAGKLDMIPGRTNILTLRATKPGVSRGQCAEYCGGAHALMAFDVVAMPEAAYSEWRAQAAAPAAAPQSARERDGLRLFMQSGCPACHTIRGAGASGRIGPDLTHVGGRLSLGAAILPNDAEGFARWIRDNQKLKPGNLMPPYEIFTEDELAALSAYLAHLR